MRYLLVLALVSSVAPAKAALPGGEVRLPLEEWETMLDQIAAEKRRVEPTPSAAVVRREIDATFDRGVLQGRLTVEFEAIIGRRPLEVALIGNGASPADVELDGSKAVVTPAGDGYGVLVAQSGRHRAVMRFVAGERQERFRRALFLPLPPAPVTLARIDLPEVDLDITVDGGAVLATSVNATRTHVELALGAGEGLSVHWQRRLSHASRTREMEARTYVVASLREDVLRCQTIIAYRILSGDTARVEIAVPKGVEVTHVTGETVLQWTTELTPQGAQTLIVLLRHIIDGGLTIAVSTQMPREAQSEIQLIRPIDTVLREGFLAVEGRPGMEITVASSSGVSEIGTRELPRELTDISERPLLFGYQYTKDAKLVLQAKRNAEVALTEAVIDELEAATVVAEPGMENTKLRMHVRNNNRQYLALELPPGAVLTHALIDGSPFHPAVSRPAKGPAVLLIPLRQSERVGNNQPRYYRVRPGDTVGGLALRYYNKVERAQDIVTGNPALKGQAEVLHVGQTLIIPRGRGGTTVEESSFVIELAYKLERGRLGLIGRQRTSLPKLDVPVMDMSWQYFFPEVYTPLSWSTNLKRHNAIRYAPIERMSQFLRTALSGKRAWAGGYANILRSRKAIFKAEQKTRVTEALASFPLVGERYRFSRVLLGTRPAEITFTYLRREVALPLRILAFVASALVGAWLLMRMQKRGLRASLSPAGWLTLLAAGVASLVVAHYVGGIHRAVLWGANAAMTAIFVRQLWTARIAKWSTEIPAVDWLSLLRLPNVLRLFALTLALGALALFPMLSGLALFGLLVLVHARWQTRVLPSVLVLLFCATATTAHAREATVPLETWNSTRAQILSIRQGSTNDVPQVIVGETHYSGRADAGFLRLHLTLRAHLGVGVGARRLPIVGMGAVVLNATSSGRPLALQRGGPGWEWVTTEQGSVTVEADILVPPSGPRGSLEYRFQVAQSPATEISCFFPSRGLSPQVTGAVTNDVRSVPGGTQLVAVLGRAHEIHIVGFHELENGGDTRTAKLYGETQNLFSLGDDRIELFSVIRLTILYAAQKRFQIALPKGYDLIKADGEGAFQYVVEEQGTDRVLTGETAYGIRQRYEISLRLARPLAPDSTDVPVALPRVLGVERDSGYVAIEVPGKLSIETIKGDGLRAIDVRELPIELIESAVTPLVRAFQYDRSNAGASTRIARYPEMPLAAGGVDELIAETVLTSDGRLMTDARFALRNNLQQYLAMKLDSAAEIQSAFVEGEPVKPSRDAKGLLLLPLVRSPQGHQGPQQIRIQLVYEMPVGALSSFGSRRLELPRLLAPLASVRWRVHIPKGYISSQLEGAVKEQTLAGHGTWSSPADSGTNEALWQETDDSGSAAEFSSALSQQATRPPQQAPQPASFGLNRVQGYRDGMMATPRTAAGNDSGAVSVRIELPRSGHTLSYVRYWVAADEPVFVRFSYLATSLLTTMRVLLLLFIATLLCLALWPQSPAPLFAPRWRRILALGAVLLAIVTWLSIGATTVVVALVSALAIVVSKHGLIKKALAVLTDFWRRSGTRAVATWTAVHRAKTASQLAAKQQRPFGAAASATARLGLTLAKVMMVVVLLALLLSIVRSLLGVIDTPV